MSIIEDRLEIVRHRELLSGAHVENTEGHMCVMEAVAYVAGEPWSDHPQCVSDTIGAFMRRWNDALPDNSAREILKPLIPEIISTAPTDELVLSYMALDWLWRVHVVAWLRLAKLTDEAEALAATPVIVDSMAWSAGAAARAAAGAAARAAAGAAARAAGRAAAWDAAGAAAWDAGRAAAWDAAGDAAWAAAGDAAWAAAWDAGRAAWDAGRAAARDAGRAAARDALAPTVAELQKSAGELVLVMASKARADA